MDTGHKLWLTWLASSVGSFAVLETLAVRHRRFNSCTVTMQWLLGIRPRTQYKWVAAAGFTLIWLWVPPHLLRIDTEKDAGVY